MIQEEVGVPPGICAPRYRRDRVVFMRSETEMASLISQSWNPLMEWLKSVKSLSAVGQEHRPPSSIVCNVGLRLRLGEFPN